MKRLTLLNGQVKNLKIRQMTKSVFASNSPQKLAKAGALTAAALGSVYASSVMASSRLKMNQEVEVFSCEVNGVKLVGCFGEVTFMNHNTIEFVVEYINEEKTEAIAHAARNVKKKVIWVLPHQDKGDVASRKSTNGFIKLFSLSFVVVAFLLMAAILFFEKGLSMMSFSVGGGGILVFASLMALMMKMFSRKDIEEAKKAAKVFYALGYKKPDQVDLGENDFKVELDIEGKTGKVPPNLPQWIYRYRDSDLMGD